MAKTIYFDALKFRVPEGQTFNINFAVLTNKESLFHSIAAELSFEMNPRNSWDAFLDQFREFCSSRCHDTAIVFSDFQEFSHHYFRLSIELIEIILLAIREHDQIVRDKLQNPHGRHWEDDKDVRIFVVLR